MAENTHVSDGISLAKTEQLISGLVNLKNSIEAYAARLRALDRMELNGIGIKKQGFIERAYELVETSPEFLPHWIPPSKFADDVECFASLRTLFDLNSRISEVLWNLVMQSADMAYKDALDFYASVREAAKCKVDAAESINSELQEFFKPCHSQSGN